MIYFKDNDGHDAWLNKLYITSVYKATNYWVVSVMPNTFFYISETTANVILAEMKK